MYGILAGAIVSLALAAIAVCLAGVAAAKSRDSDEEHPDLT